LSLVGIISYSEVIVKLILGCVNADLVRDGGGREKAGRYRRMVESGGGQGIVQMQERHSMGRTRASAVEVKTHMGRSHHIDAVEEERGARLGVARRTVTKHRQLTITKLRYPDSPKNDPRHRTPMPRRYLKPLLFENSIHLRHNVGLTCVSIQAAKSLSQHSPVATLIATSYNSSCLAWSSYPLSFRKVKHASTAVLLFADSKG